MQKILTISIAAYNIENYLERCLDSLIKVKNLELLDILIIDDGSSDKTSQIAKDYAYRYPTSLTYVAKENGGHGSTINKGITLAKGKYFRALDGDDWLSSDLDNLILKLIDCDSDAIICDYYKCYEKKEPQRYTFPLQQKTYSFKDIDDNISWLPYHCLIYKSEFLQKHNIKLDEHCFYVDTEFMLLPIPYLETFTYLPLSIYCYYLGRDGQSVSIESRIKHLKDSEIVSYRLLKYYKQQLPNLSPSKKAYFERGLANLFVWHFRSLLSTKPRFKILKALKKFDKAIYNIAPQAYYYMADKKRSKHDIRMVKILRNSYYLLYFPFVIYRRLKNKIKV